jgi:hypothetical protein
MLWSLEQISASTCPLAHSISRWPFNLSLFRYLEALVPGTGLEPVTP